MKQSKEKFGSIIVIMLFAFLAIGSADTTEKSTSQPGSTTGESQQNTNTAPEPPKEITYTPVTANVLCSEYKSNEIAADKKFKDQYLEVTGIVKSIDSDFTDMPVVHIKCGGEYDFISVDCHFESKDEAATLEKDKTIVIQGRSSGEVMGNPQINTCKIKK
ncbi:MAG: hypothetical protein WC819_03410 [Parcubacteria group bacterium]|jgi:hypothetical protein